MRKPFFSILILFFFLFEAQAQTEIRSDVVEQSIQQTRQFAEFLRHDVETVTVINDGIARVEFQDLNLDTSPTYQGVLIPFALEGRGAGNLFQQYVAIYQIIKQDDAVLDMASGSTSHKDIALLAFSQIDDKRWQFIDWKNKLVSSSRIVVPACEDSDRLEICPPNHKGSIIINLDGNTFGPNLCITYYPL